MKWAARIGMLMVMVAIVAWIYRDNARPTPPRSVHVQNETVESQPNPRSVVATGRLSDVRPTVSAEPLEIIARVDYRKKYTDELLEAYRQFLREIKGLSPEKEQALFRIWGDAQTNVLLIKEESYRIITNVVRDPTPENEAAYREFNETGIPLYFELEDETNRRVRALLSESELRAYMRWIEPHDMISLLQLGEPIQPLPNVSTRVLN